MKRAVSPRLFRIGATAILLCFIAVGRSEPGRQPPLVWLHLGGIDSAQSRQSWQALFFQPNAPWPAFMDHVTAVGVLTQVLVKMPDADLAKVAARLKEKHIGLGIAMLAQADDEPKGCGGGVEGYFPTYMVRNLAAKLQRTGAQIGYISMDEPLYFGHYYNGKNACHSSIDNVADRVAKNLHEYLQVFPNAIVGDGEPFPAITASPTWQQDFRHWMEAFHTRTGKELAFTDIDINWGVKSWPQSVQAFARFAREVKMPIGIIYNAPPPPPNMNNQGWLDAAVHNFNYIEGSLGVVPEWAVFASWVRYPGHALTDENGPGMDYVVKQYLNRHR